MVARLKHPQTVGQPERLFCTEDKARHRDPNLDDWIHGYNDIRPHTSLDGDTLETPERVLARKSQAMRLVAFLATAEVGRR